MVLPTRAAAASGPSGLGDPEDNTVPAPTAAYEPRVDFRIFSNINGLGVDIYMAWGESYSEFQVGAVGKVSGVSSADRSDFDYTITYTTTSLQTATGVSSDAYASRTFGSLESGSLVTVTLTSKTTAGSTNPAGVERTFTHTR
jgi:hypothetical protein